jgi:hypothetical protein
MTTIAATLTSKPAASSSWKQLIRRALVSLGKHYSHGPYML